MRMAQVRTKPVKGHNEYVDAENRQQIDLIAEQEHKAGDRDALNKRTSRREDQPFDGVGACHGQRGQCFGTVMELVEVPQGRNPVQCVMHHKTCEIIKEKKDKINFVNLLCIYAPYTIIMQIILYISFYKK